ncbi:PucR family transcriptional regulator [Kutzneria sp. NPDC052558]|uniref:PucR family transcriptional regulator n=1 Tax=Kutzneria sp. NPDC052558 TaxID=3364121 RepID=UPI0037C647AF
MHKLSLLAAELRDRLVGVDAPADPALVDLCDRFTADAIRGITDGAGEGQAEDAAREIVAAGISPDTALAALRTRVHAVWNLARELARERDAPTSRELLERAADIWLEHEHWTSAIGRACREAGWWGGHRDAQERQAHVSALLTGAGGDQALLRRSAEVLGLPKSGRFCVVVMESGAAADTEPTLRARGVVSVWLVDVAEQVGIVSLGAAGSVGTVREAMRSATGRVGLSPVYDQLSHSPLAVRLAHVALTASPPGSPGVVGYGDRPLQTLVASAPETARDMARIVLGGLLELPEESRRLLLDTLDVWCRAGGNVNRSAELLYCHRNTVRHRLARIEELTGRSLSDPLGIAETLMATHAHRLHS